MPPSRQGTGFQNLNTYLGLNQGASKAMGDTLAADVEKEGGDVSNRIGDAYYKFLEQSQKGTLRGGGVTPYDPNHPSAMGGILTAADAERRSKMGYTGPETLGAAEGVDLGNLMTSAATAQNKANALGTQEGLQNAIAQKYGQSSWGGGALDAALAGQGGAARRLEAAKGSYGKLLQNLNATQQNAADVAASAKKTSADAARQYGQQVEGLKQQEAATAEANQAERERQKTERLREKADYKRNPYGRDERDSYP